MTAAGPRNPVNSLLAAMRIKKQTPKPSARRPPLYFVGYRGTAPATDELKAWYEREYGGPLIIRHEAGSAESWHASHGPWSAHVVMPLPMSHVSDVMKQLAWEHDVMGAVAPSLVSPRDIRTRYSLPHDSPGVSRSSLKAQPMTSSPTNT